MPRKDSALHDWLIDQLAATNGFGTFASENGFSIPKNPGLERRQSATFGEEEMWPDILVFDPKAGKNRVRKIGEIETEETVTIDHAKGQWDLYSRASAGNFVLAVPDGSTLAAKQIITQLGVVCHLWTYTLNFDPTRKLISATFEAQS